MSEKPVSAAVMEKNFFLSLRFVATHLIKHVKPELCDELMPVVTEYEMNQWGKRGASEKKSEILKLQKSISDHGEIEKHFKDYPHKWSKDKYAEFHQRMADYLAEL